MKRKDINDVLRDRHREFMAIPDVVGICVGLHPVDDSPCLKVLVIKETEEHRNKIPKNVEGYPVFIEESGRIRPL